MSKKNIPICTPPRIKWMRPIEDKDIPFSASDTALAVFPKPGRHKKKASPTATIMVNFFPISTGVTPGSMVDTNVVRVIDETSEEVSDHEL